MLPMMSRPQAEDITDHWAWRPEWTPHRPRLLWYLTFEQAPDVEAAAVPCTDVLWESGADIVPPEWLHLTVNHVGFADELDAAAVRAAADEIRRRLQDVEPFDLTLGPVEALPDAIVLAAGPAGQVSLLRAIVCGAMAHTGMAPPDDLDEVFWPHVSLCYLNRRTDHARLMEAVRAAEPATVQVRCDRLVQVLVTRSHGHYRWEVLDEVPLGRPSPEPAQPHVSRQRQS